jgi:uncharacterized Zn finger protein (UPF0148 family)
MDYPDGEWKFCDRCGSSYYRYVDGVGRCSTCAEERRKRYAKEAKRKKAKDNKIKRLEKENKILKEKLSNHQNQER